MSDDSVVMEKIDDKHRTWRVRVVSDPHPDLPYDDGSVPLWRLDYRGLGWTAEQVGMSSYKATDVPLSDAINKFGNPNDRRVERWLRAYYGTSVVEVWHSGEAWYLAADSARWRETVGVSVERMREEAQRGSLMAEYRAWCSGEVYGYVIERKRVAYTTVIEPADGEIIGTRKTEEWTSVDDGDGSLFGLFGHEYAVKTAEEDLKAYLYNLDREENPWRYERITLVNPETVN